MNALRISAGSFYIDSAMPLPVTIQELEIIGYATVLKETMLPSVVAPVFRLRTDPNIAFVPPYLLNQGYLCNATRVSAAELGTLADKVEITLFPGQPLRAQQGHELWIDQAGAAHYEPQSDAHAALLETARREIAGAEMALTQGKTEEAEKCCNIALCADDRLIEPLAIKAAIRRQQGDSTGERLIAKLALPRMTPGAFCALVDFYSPVQPTACQTPRATTTCFLPDLFCIRPMRGMAAVRAVA